MRSPTLPLLEEGRALEVVLAAEAAWNARNLRALAEHYTEDITYWTNWGGPNNGPRTVAGRSEFIRYLAAARDAIDCNIRLTSFRLRDDQGRGSLDVRLCDPRSGLRHSTTCRLILTFAGDRIRRIQEFHDASALLAFMDLVAGKGDVR